MTMQDPLLAVGQYDSASMWSQHAGSQKVFEDIDYSTAVRGQRTNYQVTRRLVKNSSGITLLAKRTVQFKAGTNRTEVDGYSTTTANDGKTVVVVDEWLTAGVPDGSYFWVTVHGPTECLTDLAGGANNLIPEETVLVALTAATSGATTAGRVAPQDLTGATAVLGNQINGAFARALSAKTTANTNADILVFLGNRWD